MYEPCSKKHFLPRERGGLGAVILNEWHDLLTFFSVFQGMLDLNYYVNFNGMIVIFYLSVRIFVSVTFPVYPCFFSQFLPIFVININ